MVTVFLTVMVLFFDPVHHRSARLQTESGNAYLEQGLLVQARQAFTRALDANPHEHYALLGLARVSALEGSLPLAAYWYGVFMERVPDDHRGPLEMGLLLLDHPDSLARCGVLLRTALVLEPASPEVRFAGARLLLLEGDTLAAFSLLRPLTVTESTVRVGAGFLLASALTARGEASEAVALIQEEPFRGDPRCLWLVCRIRLEEGDVQRALDAMHRLLTQFPGCSWADSARFTLDSLAREGAYLPD